MTLMTHMPTTISVMTPFPYCVQVDDSLVYAREVMVRHQIRHLPVKKGSLLVGVLSDRDLKRALDPDLGLPPKEELFVSVHAEGFRRLHEVVDRGLEGKTDPWARLEAAVAAHLTELVGSTDVAAVTGASLFHMEGTHLQRRLNRQRESYEERFRKLIQALPLPADVDRSLLRLALLGAINWTRVWYRPGKRTPAEIAQHLVRKILVQRLR